MQHFAALLVVESDVVDDEAAAESELYALYRDVPAQIVAQYAACDVGCLVLRPWQYHYGLQEQVHACEYSYNPLYGAFQSVHFALKMPLIGLFAYKSTRFFRLFNAMS